MTIPDQFAIDSYDFPLPEELIAQVPAPRRDASRLLVLDCSRHAGPTDRHFSDIIELLADGDILVVNDTRVFPARLEGKKDTGGKVELFLLAYPRAEGDQDREARATCLIKASKRPRPGATLHLAGGLTAIIEGEEADGTCRVLLSAPGNLAEAIENAGNIPLPPYIRREEGTAPQDRERYQTVYAASTGAVAAPTAGLHFSPELLQALQQRGVVIVPITLHVGYGTFSPVRAQDIRQHRIHEEYVEVSRETADAINEKIQAGGRLWAVGTTTARTLEYAADEDGCIVPTKGWCSLYIIPGYRFRVVRNLITNFHLPRSSLLFLVSALAGRERMLDAYRHAVAHAYRFFSYGDAMAILTDGPQSI